MINLLASGVKKLFPLVLTLFLILPGNAIAEETMCKDLKKVNNLDELLYQFYIHLDRDCLFTMPLSELEKVWGIKILSKERLQQGQSGYDLRMSTEFDGKPYQSEADAFFVVANSKRNNKPRFIIYITEAYVQEHATLFPEGNYPKLLPKPFEYLVSPPPDYRYPPGGTLPRSPKKTGVYSRDTYYYWLNAKRTRMISTFTGHFSSVAKIDIYDEIPSSFLKNVIEQK